jgi:hypothetical protein
MAQRLSNRLGIVSSSRHRKAEAVAHGVRMLLGNFESSGLSGFAEPLVEESTAQRLFGIPL